MIHFRILIVLLFCVARCIAQEDDYVSSARIDTGLVIIYTADGNQFSGKYIKADEQYYTIEDLAVGEVRVKRHQVQKFVLLRSGDEIEVTLVNGNIIKGTVDIQYSDKIVLRSKSSEKIEIPYSKIVQFRKKGDVPKEKQKSPKKIEDDPDPDERVAYAFNQRHFLSHNAFIPKRRSGVGRTSMFLVYHFDYAVLEPLSLRLTTLGFYPVLGLKSGFNITGDLRIGINTDVLILPFAGQTFLGGYLHPMLTYGDIHNNITAGSVFLFTNEFFYPNPILAFAGNLRLSSNLSLVSDNFLVPYDLFYYNQVPEYLGIYSLGIRFTGDRASYDGGLFVIPQLWQELRIPIPLISYSTVF